MRCWRKREQRRASAAGEGGPRSEGHRPKLIRWPSVSRGGGGDSEGCKLCLANVGASLNAKGHTQTEKGKLTISAVIRGMRVRWGASEVGFIDPSCDLHQDTFPINFLYPAIWFGIRVFLRIDRKRQNSMMFCFAACVFIYIRKESKPATWKQAYGTSRGSLCQHPLQPSFVPSPPLVRKGGKA